MYQITIKKIERVERKGERKWMKLHSMMTFDNDDQPQYGYVDDESAEEKESVEYEQTVKDLNLVSVIKAVNGMYSNP